MARRCKSTTPPYGNWHLARTTTVPRPDCLPCASTAEQKLSSDAAADVSFSADGHWVAYAMYPEPILWRSRIDGSEKLQLTRPRFFALNPSWSPDGKKILFTGADPGKGFAAYTIGAEGGAPQQILAGPDFDVLFPSGPRMANRSFFRRAKGTTRTTSNCWICRQERLPCFRVPRT